MRRKRKHGVYTNRSIKKFISYSFCKVCKSVCKSGFPKLIDPSTNWHHYDNPNRKSLSYFGFGSLLPGKKFVEYDKNQGFKYRYLRNEIFRKEQIRKWELRDMVNEAVCNFETFGINN